MTVVDTVSRILDGFLDAFSSLKLETFMSYFCEDASVFFPFDAVPKRVDGRRDIELLFKQFFDTQRQGPGPKYLELSPQDVKIIPLETSVLVTFHLNNKSSRGRRSIVLVDRGRGFQILHLHASNTQALKNTE